MHVFCELVVKRRKTRTYLSFLARLRAQVLVSDPGDLAKNPEQREERMKKFVSRGCEKGSCGTARIFETPTSLRHHHRTYHDDNFAN